ncbi:ATP-binding protein [Halomicrococcus sp. SG-WS-1]|uniref:ATP-binding protein n=1 Tax=Halomicrococcus sp. SG-WS-1 TaxID=3439057 RepID=UPI003F78D960
MTERDDGDIGAGIYRTAFRGTRAPAIITDPDLVVRDANDACLEFTGYSRPELVGQTALDLFEESAVCDEIVATLARGDTWNGEVEVATKDGRLVYGRGSCTPVTVDGETRGYVGFFTDRTQHRQYEQSLRILNRVLRHNLRNDANVVLGRIEMVAEQVDDLALRDSLATAREKVDAILDYAETARNLDDLLSNTGSSLHPVRLDEVLRRKVRAAAERYPDAEFVTDFGSDPVVVAADDAVGTALEAVLVNAVQHNDKATPRVAVDVAVESGHATVTVADNGPGVPASERDRIFGREEIDAVHHGQGLKLFFVDRLMETYGGEVWAEDNDPEGSAFKLQFRTSDES